MSSEVIYLSACDLADRIRREEFSSVEVVTTYLKEIERVNPKLNAVVQLSRDSALKRARDADEALGRGEIWGPLHGVPVTIKDGWETEGIISSGGTTGRASFVPTTDATVVARIRSAGAIILGKTNVPELSLTCETDNAVYGRTNNPYDLSCTPGGSGGAQAAIIAAGGSPLDIGCDAGGSIRLPAHYCGIAGIKPTTGLIPMTGYFPLPAGLRAQLTAAGPMARTVKDLALVLPILVGGDWGDPYVVPRPFKNCLLDDPRGLRVAFYTSNRIITPTKETQETVRRAVEILAEGGLEVEERTPPAIDETYEIFANLMGADGGAEVERMLRLAGTREMSPWLRRRHEALRGREMSVAKFCELLSQLDSFRRSMITFLRDFDVIVCPVNGSSALPHGTTYDGDNAKLFSYAQTYNLTGWPAVAIRAGTSSRGLPIGVQIVARPWCEHVALSVADYLESALPHWSSPKL
jgi:amidase